MIIKLLGIFDILVAILFWLLVIFRIDSLSGIVLLFGLFLLVKGIVFAINFNITSILDIISSFIIIISGSVTIPFLLVGIVSLFLLQKGIFSLLS
ncbi:hypothetical protein J4221_03950 [Candidatus Pacearchaeota archaeon]|nr:hypothetical protein [Candidatus Pacearchaeota archaeon]